MARKKYIGGINCDVLVQLIKQRGVNGAADYELLAVALNRDLAERMLNTVTDVHPGGEVEQSLRSHRSGASPHDGHGRFDPVLIGTYQRRFPGCDARVIATCAR